MHTIQEISHLATSTVELITATREHLSSQSSVISATHCGISEFESRAQLEFEQHAETEARYLAQEYKVYTPSGKFNITFLSSLFC